jgi:WD40 repeat protein
MTRSPVVIATFICLAATPIVTSRPAVPAPGGPIGPPRLDFNGEPLPPGATARIGTVRFRHEAGVHLIAFSPDGRTVYTGCLGNAAVRAWSTTDGREVRRFGGNTVIGALCVSADGRMLATGEQGNAIRLWNTTTGQEARRMSVDLPEVRANFGSPGPQVRWLRFGPGDATLFAGYQQGNIIIIWDLLTGKEMRRLTPDGGGLFALSGDGKRLATRAGRGVAILDTATDRTTQTIAVSDDANNQRQMVTFALSPDGHMVVTSADDAVVQFWDANTGKEVRKATLAGMAGMFAFSPDSSQLAAISQDGEDGTVVALVDPATGKERRRLAGFFSGTFALTFSPDGKTLATGGSGNTLRLWETATGTEVQPAAGHTGGVTTIAVSPDGKLLATCSVHDKAVRLWDTTSGAEIRRLEGHAAGVDEVSFSPDGKLLASSSWNQPVRIWEVSTGDLLHTFIGHAALGPYMRFADDGTILATGSRANTVALWDCKAGKLIRELPAPPHGLASLLTFHDGRLLAYENPETADDEDRSIGLWDVTANRLVRRFEGHKGRVNGVILSADTRLLASRGADKTIRVWEVASGAERCKFPEPGTTGLTGSWTGTQFLAFSPDNRALVTCASDDSFARRWDLATRKELPPLAGHRSWVGAVEFSANGRILVSGSQDTTALTWDGATIAPRTAAALVRTETELTALWDGLGGRDASRAHAAIWALINSGNQAAESIGSRLPPAEPVDDTLIVRWIGDLDNQQFAVRERATAALVRVADRAEGALRAALDQTRSAETRQRVRHILESATDADLSPDRLREVRAVEVLESIGTPTARERLATLARGANGAYLTREAEAALRRLRRRVVPS